MSDVEIHTSGPFFDGRAAHAVTEFLDAAMDDVAQQGFSDWMTNLNEDIRWPTPYYETQINIRNEGSRRVINDRGIVYGPWLEGTGSRNAPVTSFEGYHGAFHAMNRLIEQATPLAERRLSEFIRRMQ